MEILNIYRKALKLGIVLFILGIITCVDFNLYYKYKLNEQPEWLCIEAELQDVQSWVSEDYVRLYRGVYTAKIDADDTLYTFYTKQISNTWCLPNVEVFYVNPNNYKDYHIEYTEEYIFEHTYSYFVVLCIGFWWCVVCIILIYSYLHSGFFYIDYEDDEDADNINEDDKDE